jgi:hypothetical protein
MAYCIKCGEQVTEGSTFCNYCGYRITDFPNNKKDPSVSPATNENTGNFKSRPTARPAKKINPHLFIILVWGGFAMFIAGIMQSKDNTYAMTLLIPSGLVSVISGYIYSLICLYRCWQAIQGFTARTTAGKAVGFLFIPIYNLFWVFVSLKGLASDANEFLENRGEKKKISEGLSVTTATLYVIPYINLFVPVLISILIYQWADFYNLLVDKWDKLSTMPVKADETKQQRVHYVAIALTAAIGSLAILGIIAAIAVPQFIKYRSMGYASSVNIACQNAYNSSVEFIAGNPNTAVPSDSLVIGGKYIGQGITAEITSWVDSSNYVITCKGKPDWRVSEATVQVVNGKMTLYPAKTGHSWETGQTKTHGDEAPAEPSPAVSSPAEPSPVNNDVQQADEKILMSAFEKEARKMNAKLPKLIDNETRMEKMIVGPGKKVTYVYTLVVRSSSEMDANAFYNDLRPYFINNICKGDMKDALKMGVTFIYSYYGNDNGHIADIPITAAGCGFGNY